MDFIGALLKAGLILLVMKIVAFGTRIVIYVSVLNLVIGMVIKITGNVSDGKDMEMLLFGILL